MKTMKYMELRKLSCASAAGRRCRGDEKLSGRERMNESAAGVMAEAHGAQKVGKRSAKVRLLPNFLPLLKFEMSPCRIYEVLETLSLERRRERERRREATEILREREREMRVW